MLGVLATIYYLFGPKAASCTPGGSGDSGGVADSERPAAKEHDHEDKKHRARLRDRGGPLSKSVEEVGLALSGLAFLEYPLGIGD